MKKLTVVFVFFFLLGCNSVERLEKQWLGRDKSTLIAVKGTPDETTSDGFGGQIYTYITYSTYPYAYGAYHEPYGWPYHRYRYGLGYHHSQVTTGTAKTMFWIDPFDKIYRISVAH